MSEPTPDPAPSPAAEARLHEVLGPLRGAEPPESGGAIAPAVLRALRWQTGVRGALRTGGLLAAAAADAVAIVIGGGRRERR